MVDFILDFIVDMPNVEKVEEKDTYLKRAKNAMVAEKIKDAQETSVEPVEEEPWMVQMKEIKRRKKLNLRR